MTDREVLTLVGAGVCGALITVAAIAFIGWRWSK